MHSTKYGGLEKYNIDLAKKGIELSLVYNSLPKSVEYIRDIDRHNIPLHVVNGGFISRAIQIAKIIKSEEPSIIHYHFGKLMYILAPLCAICFPKMSQVYTIHCEFPELNRFESFLMGICVRCFDLIICVSEGVRQGFIKKYKSHKVTVSYLGVRRRQLLGLDLRKKLNIDEDIVVLTSVGFDVKVKGYDILAEAVMELNKKKSIPNYKILLIGLSQSEEESLDRILKKLEIEDYFISVGIVNNIDDFLNISDIYLQPSRTEAISLSIMEAMQYALPIIGTRTGGIPEVCIDNENGFLFEKEDAIELASLMNKLICDPVLRKTLGAKSVKLSSEFGLENSVSRLINLYQNL